MNKLKSATISQKGRWGGEGETPGGNARHGLLAIGSFIPSTTVGEFLSRKVARGQWPPLSCGTFDVDFTPRIAHLSYSHSPSLTPSLFAVDRAMSPAQSEDSGLAPERGTTYATITLPRNALHLAINFAGKRIFETLPGKSQPVEALASGRFIRYHYEGRPSHPPPSPVARSIENVSWKMFAAPCVLPNRLGNAI